VNIYGPAINYSYAPGSAGFAFLLHEIGHALGLKHPHDSGGTGGPTFIDLGLKDWATVMSYQDDYQWNLLHWEPATYMVLDVLALQTMYGANLQTNAGNNTHLVTETGSYTTIWDAGGTDTVDASTAGQAWTIVLPDIVLSSQNGTKVGSSEPTPSVSQSSPQTIQWLLGDMENARGSRFADHIVGSGLNNALRGDGGNDSLEGRGGIDTGTYSGIRAQYTVQNNGTSATVTDNVAGRDDVDTLSGIERLKFSDNILALDVDGHAGQAYRLYQAAFDRTPDTPGLSYWVNNLDHGVTLSAAAASFIVSNEFKAAYGDPAVMSSSTFLDTLYQNILGRPPDPAGKAYWQGELDYGLAREYVLASFSESVENKELVGTTIANGVLLDAAWFI
jgi:hypothetical protein